MSELASLRRKHVDCLYWAAQYRAQAATPVVLKGDGSFADKAAVVGRRLAHERAAQMLSVVAPSIRKKLISEKAYRASLPKLTTDGRANPYAIGEAA